MTTSATTRGLRAQQLASLGVLLFATLLLSGCDAAQIRAAIAAEQQRRAEFTAVITTVTAVELGASWRPGCPVGPDGLRAVTVSYWGMDGLGHRGTLVVSSSVTGSVTQAFRALWNMKFPISSMRPVSEFGGDDRASMVADNTSAFNCRTVAGSTRLSEHAFGRALDINPLRNPWVSRSRIDPPEAAAFVDRRRRDPGMFRAGEPAVRALASAGWRWGGSWASSKDYQHFSTTGR